MNAILLLKNTFCNRQMLSYILWGGVSIVFNISVFNLLVACEINYKAANVITLILLKIFVFFTNKFFVFTSAATGLKATIREFLRFLTARIFTNLIDFFGLIFLVELLHQNASASKMGLAIIVVLLNFVFSKWFVFIGVSPRKKQFVS